MVDTQKEHRHHFIYLYLERRIKYLNKYTRNLHSKDEFTKILVEL